MGRYILPTCLLALLPLGACSTADSAGAPPPAAIRAYPAAEAGLPELSSLDSRPGRAQRGVSVIEEISVNVESPLLQFGCTTGSGQLELGSFPEMAWAMYRVALPEGPLKVCSFMGSGAATTLFVADYGRGRWVPMGRADGVQHNYNLELLQDYSSPFNYIYLAVAARRSEAGGGDSDVLSALSVTWDAPVSGPVYYVEPAPAGDDANPGTSAEPWASLQHAADTVVAGDTVIVRPGTYTGFMLQSSGSESSPITFSAEEGAVINARNENTPDGINIENWEGTGVHHVVIEGFTVLGIERAGIRVVGLEESPAHHVTVRNCLSGNNGKWGLLSGHANYVTVEDCEMYNSGDEHGIYLSNSSDNCICRGNILFGNNGCGIHHNGDSSAGGDGIMSNCLIENNIAYDNGDGGGSAINCDGVQDSIIRNNLLFNNHSSGISLYQIDAGGPARNNQILNNTIVQDGANTRWCLNIQDDSGEGCKVFNNIFFNYHSFRGAIDINNATLPGFESDYNVVISRFVINDGNQLDLAEWRSATGQDMHSIAAAAADVLVNPQGPDLADYMLKVGSPALNAGLESEATDSDLQGTPRPQGSGPDIGCFEQP
ncbi:right-handed parallel beta-helix repeat-containing protein [bacterium]|nr:right-handed parallel beta-helix repeat-containing protein [bacterium]